MQARIESIDGESATVICLDSELKGAPFLQRGKRVKLLLPVSVLQQLNDGDEGTLEVAQFAGHARLNFKTGRVTALCNFSVLADEAPEITL